MSTRISGALCYIDKSSALGHAPPMGAGVLVDERMRRLAEAGRALGIAPTAAQVAALATLHAAQLGFTATVALIIEYGHQLQLSDGRTIDDNEEEPHAVAVRTREPFESEGVWAIPLLAGEQVLGALGISTRAEPLAPLDRSFAVSLAHACAAALERVRLDGAERRVRGEAYRIYGQLETLARAGALVSTSHDVDATVRTVVSLPLSEFADGCIFEAMDEDLPALEVAHIDPAQEQALREFFAPEPSFRNPAVREWAVDATDPLLLEVNSAFWQVSYPQQSELLARLRIRSMILVPLLELGRHVGMFTFVRMTEPYEEGDVPFAAELCRRLSSALENARLYDAAQRAIQLRDDFISIAAHELKTPLAALQMRLNMLVVKAEGSPVEASAVRCESYARDLSALVNQLLDVTRMAAGQMRLDLEPVDIVRVVQDVSARYTDLAQQAGGVVTLTLPEKMIGVWDKIKLEQVVGNLLTNAIKYGSGGPISISVAATDTVCELIVRDSGGGIAPEEQGRIFRRFHRVTTSGGGFGLGLWIVKQVVEALGGTVMVESALGAGSTFTVSLPLTRAPKI